MLDGFSGYNQIAVEQVGLMNVGATFQRDMDLAFIGEVNMFIAIYLDDLTVFSQSDSQYLKHQQCKLSNENCTEYLFF